MTRVVLCFVTKTRTTWQWRSQGHERQLGRPGKEVRKRQSMKLVEEISFVGKQPGKYSGGSKNYHKKVLKAVCVFVCV